MVVVGSSTAHADKKIQDMVPGYDRELTGCQTQASGMQKVATGAATLAKTAEGTDKDELDKAAAALAKGSAAFTDYCTELAALKKFLEDNSAAAYKSVEREIDNRATKVSQLRRTAKKAADDLGPLTRKLIPRITKLPTVAPEPEKRMTAKFPSGRTVSLPLLSGSWKLGGTAISDVAEYADKTTAAVVTTRQLDGDCDQQKKSSLGMLKDAQLVDLEIKDVAWAVRYVRREASGAHVMEMVCRPRSAGSALVVVDIRPDTTTLVDALTKVALDMLAIAK